MNDASLKHSLKQLRVPEPSEAARGRALHRAMIAFEQRDSLSEKPARKRSAWLWGGAVATLALVALILATQPIRLLNHRGDIGKLSLNEAQLRAPDQRFLDQENLQLVSQKRTLAVEERMPVALEQRMLTRGQMEVDAPRAGVIARPLVRPSSEVVFQNRLGIREASDGSAAEVNGPIKAKLTAGGVAGGLGGALNNANAATFVAAATAPVAPGNGYQNKYTGGTTISSSADASSSTHATLISAANISNSDALAARERSSVGGITPPIDPKIPPAVSLPDAIPLGPAAPLQAQQAPEKAQTNPVPKPDPIDTLIADFSQSYGLWENGAFPIIDLPQTATPQEVLGQVLKMTSFGNNRVKDFKVLEIRMIQIKNSGSDSYHAALVWTDLGEKVVLFNYVGRGLWWSRVFEAGKTYYGKPSLSPAESLISPTLNSLLPNHQYDWSAPSQKSHAPDPICAFVAKLSVDGKWGLWQNGLFTSIKLPSSASPEEVIAQVNKQTNLYQAGKLTNYKIIESRPVKLGSVFIAVLLETNLGQKILLLQYQGASVGWWSRVYDVPAPETITRGFGSSASAKSAS